jgi:ABC-type phosphate transport system ATPase subunit
LCPVDPDAHLTVEWLGVETRDLAERLADQGIRHAVIDDEVEADLSQGKTQLAAGTLQRAGFAREIGTQIDDGNGFGRRAHSAACG